MTTPSVDQRDCLEEKVSASENGEVFVDIPLRGGPWSPSHQWSIASSIEGEVMCRYCFETIQPAQQQVENCSSCRCAGFLCRTCIEGELALTHDRKDGTMRCTVCNVPYNVSFKRSGRKKRFLKSFFTTLVSGSACLSTCVNYGPLSPRAGGPTSALRPQLTLEEAAKIAGWLLLMAGWYTATTFFAVLPLQGVFEPEAAMITVFVVMDLFAAMTYLAALVSSSVAVNFIMMIFNIARFVAILVMFPTDGANAELLTSVDVHAYFYVGVSGFMVTLTMVLFLSVCVDFWERFKSANSEIYIGDKGPFNLRRSRFRSRRDIAHSQAQPGNPANAGIDREMEALPRARAHAQGIDIGAGPEDSAHSIAVHLASLEIPVPYFDANNGIVMLNDTDAVSRGMFL